MLLLKQKQFIKLNKSMKRAVRFLWEKLESVNKEHRHQIKWRESSKERLNKIKMSGHFIFINSVQF